MSWPTPQQWLVALRRAKAVLAISWAVTVAALLLLGMIYGADVVGMYIAAFSLAAVTAAALLEIANDSVNSRIADRELSEFGRRRYAEVNRSFPRVEGLDALAKDESSEARRPDVQESRVMPVVPGESTEAGNERNGGGDTAAGGGGRSIS